MGKLNKDELKAAGFDAAANEWNDTAFIQSLSNVGFFRYKAMIDALAASTAPIALAAPQIASLAVIGQTITAQRGDYTNTPTSFTQRWLLNGEPITGAIDTQYTLVAQDFGKALTFEETPTNMVNTGRPNVSNSVTIQAADPSTITLKVLTLAANSVVENTGAGAVIGGVMNMSLGSSISLVDTAGGRFALNGTNIVTGTVATDYETATSHQITVRETLVGSPNSPKDTIFTIGVTNVNEQPNLGTLALSNAIFTISTPASGTITGATAGSTITASGLPSGLTIDGAARTWAWSGTGTPASSTITLVETLSDSANSPKSTQIAVAINSQTLVALTLNANSILENSISGTSVGNLVGKSAGSTLSLVDDAGGRFALSGTSIVAGLVATSYSTATSHTVTVRETLANSPNSPKDTVLTIDVVSASSMTPFKLIYDFENVIGLVPNGATTLSMETGNRKTLGSAAMRIQGNTAGTYGLSSGTVSTTSLDFKDYDVVAVAIDLGDENTRVNTMNDVRIAIGDYNNVAPSGVVSSVIRSSFWRGKYWLSFNLANYKNANGDSIKLAGATAKNIVASVVQQPGAGSSSPDVVVDSLIALKTTDLRPPAVLFTFDDNNISQFTNGKDIFAQYGFAGTLYVPSALVDVGSGKMSLAQLRQMRDLGWGMCVDSTPDDAPMTAETLLATSIQKLKDCKQYVADNLGTEGIEHFCWSYGNTSYNDVPVSVTFTSDGANPSVLSNMVRSSNGSSMSGYSNFQPGLQIFDGTTRIGEVVKLLSQTAILASIQIPAGTHTFTFCARIPQISVTCDGTNVVSVSSTQYMFLGMHMLGYNVPLNTKITAIDPINNLITLSAPVPASCRIAEFGHVDGEYWGSKVADAIMDAGFMTGRLGVTGNSVFSQYGVDKRNMLFWNAFNSDLDAATLIPQLAHNMSEGRDSILYSHQIDDISGWNARLSQLKQLQDAGKCEVLTVPKWYNKTKLRLPIRILNPTLTLLQALSDTIAENTSANTKVTDLVNTTPGSTLTLTDDAGGRFKVQGTAIYTGTTNTDYETATSHQVRVLETLGTATNSPLESLITIKISNLFEQPNLSALSLSTSSVSVNLAASISILGATAGSTITATGLPAGMSINSTGRTITGTPSQTGSFTITLVETIADSANSPRTSSVNLTIQALAGTVSIGSNTPTGISLLTRNGLNAQSGARWASIPTLTNLFGTGTAGAAGALSLRVRFKPGEMIGSSYNNSVTGTSPIGGTNGLTGGGTLYIGFGGFQVVSTPQYAGRFYAIVKDNANTTVTLISQKVDTIIDAAGVLCASIVIRRDSTGAFTLDVFDNAGNKLAGDPVTPSTWVGKSTNRPFVIGYDGSVQPTYGLSKWFPGAFSDFVHLDVAGSDAEWSSFVRGNNPSAIWSSGLAAHYSLRNPTDLAKTSGSRSNYVSATLGSDGAGLPHSFATMGKMSRSSDGTKGLGWVPVYRGYTHALSPSVVRACTSVSDLRNATGTIVRDVRVDGAATHLEARAARKSDGVIVRDWTRVTSSPVTGKAEISLSGIRAGSMELILEVRREDDTNVVSQCADDNRVGIVTVMGPSQQSMLNAMYGTSTDPQAIATSASTTVTVAMFRQSTNLGYVPMDGGYLMHNNQTGSGAIALAQYWDSLNSGVPLEIVPMTILNSMTTDYLYHRNTTQAGTACNDYFGDGNTLNSGFATSILLAKKKRVTMFLLSWYGSDRPWALSGGTLNNLSTIYGSRSMTELPWPARMNELFAGVPKTGASASELSERTNFVSSGLTAWQPWTIVIPVSRFTTGNVTNPESNTNTLPLYTAYRKMQYDYAEVGTGRDASAIVSLGGFQNDIRMDSQTSSTQHMTDPMGQLNFGLKLGHAIAHVTKASTINPRSKFVTITGGGTDTLTLTLSMPNGGNLMTGVNGATITGFDVSIDNAANWSYFDGTVLFTATIAGNVVQLKKTSGTWPVGTLVRYLSGAPLSRSTTTGAEGDDPANLAGMLYESRADAVPSTISGIPAGVPVMPTIDPIAAVTTGQFTVTQPAANTTYQRSTETGGSLGKGTGTIPVAINVTTIGPIYARIRATDNTILQQPVYVGTPTATGAQVFNVPNVSAGVRWFYVDLSSDGVTWIQGTNRVQMGDIIVYVGNNAVVRFFNGFDSGTDPNPISSRVSAGKLSSPNPNGVAYAQWYLGGSNGLNPATWEVPSDSGRYPSAHLVERFNREIELRGVGVAIAGYANAGTTITGMATDGNLQAILTTIGGFTELHCAMGPANSTNSTGALKTAYSTLIPAVATYNTVKRNNFVVTMTTFTNIATNATYTSFDNMVTCRYATESWCRENRLTYRDAIYIDQRDVDMFGGYTPSSDGGIVYAQHLYRTSRKTYGLTTNDVGAKIISATRASGSANIVMTVQLPTGATALSINGTAAQAASRFGVYDWNSTSWASTPVYSLDATTPLTLVNNGNGTATITLKLASAPADTVALSVFFDIYPTPVADGSVGMIYDNLVDGDGITRGRAMQPTIQPLDVFAPGVTAPANTVAPTLSGSGRPGFVARASVGTWTGSPVRYTYEFIWSDTSEVRSHKSGYYQTATTYNFTGERSDLGHAPQVRVTAFNAGGATSILTTALPTVEDRLGPDFTVSGGTPTFVASATGYGQQYQAADNIRGYFFVGGDLLPSTNVWCVKARFSKSGNPSTSQRIFDFQNKVYAQINANGTLTVNLQGASGANPVTTTGTYTDGATYEISIDANGNSGATVYINGQQVLTTATVPTTAIYDLHYIASSNSGQYMTNGTIDLLATYNTPQGTAVLTKSPVGNETGLRTLYLFDGDFRAAPRPAS